MVCIWVQLALSCHRDMQACFCPAPRPCTDKSRLQATGMSLTPDYPLYGPSETPELSVTQWVQLKAGPCRFKQRTKKLKIDPLPQVNILCLIL